MKEIKEKILVTGGLGFIGSHTVVELIKAGYNVVILDDLSNSQLFILKNIEKITGEKVPFYKIDVADPIALLEVLDKEENISAVIHFAAFKAVSESVVAPLKYFRNNLYTLLNLLECIKEKKINKLVFSSSATVYGDPDNVPVTELTPFKKALSAYGSTKQMGEEILEKVAHAENLKVVSLRYFNPVGAHESALLGELPIGTPNNLMPYVTQTAAGLRTQLTVFGQDYSTTDGTCVRDYIHVVDLAHAHVKAVDRLLENKQQDPYVAFNIGTGNGVSVLELIRAFKKYNELTLNYTFGAKRAGDAAVVYADVKMAKKELGWKANLTLEDMVTSAWLWQKNINSF